MNDLFGNTTIEKGADFSKDRKYRYALWRIWDHTKTLAMCIGLNPSTANEHKNDNTINILVRVLEDLKYGGFYMTNLFAYISSNPDDLLTCDDPIGDNDNKLREIRKKCQDVIVCWGGFQQAENRIKDVLPSYPNAKCFGVNANGTPWHPRALSYKKLLNNAQLINYKQTPPI